jgi:hypothetical protein
MLKEKAGLYLSGIEGFPKRSDDVAQRAGMQIIFQSRGWRITSSYISFTTT